RCTELCSGCGEGASCDPVTLNRFSKTIQTHACHLDLVKPDLQMDAVPVDVNGSQEVQIQIPPGLASFVVTAFDTSSSTSHWVGFLSLVAPDGTVLLDDRDNTVDLNPPSNRSLSASSVLVPSTNVTNAFPQEGTYKLRIALFDSDLQSFTPVA